MYVRQERKTYAYKTTIDIDIKNVNTFDERKTPQIHNGSQYMKLEEYYFIESNIFPNVFLNTCKDNANEAITIQCKIKNDKKGM